MILFDVEPVCRCISKIDVVMIPVFTLVRFLFLELVRAFMGIKPLNKGWH